MREKKIQDYEVKMAFMMGKNHPDPIIKKMTKMLE